MHILISIQYTMLWGCVINICNQMEQSFVSRQSCFLFTITRLPLLRSDHWCISGYCWKLKCCFVLLKIEAFILGLRIISLYLMTMYTPLDSYRFAIFQVNTWLFTINLVQWRKFALVNEAVLELLLFLFFLLLVFLQL